MHTCGQIRRYPSVRRKKNQWNNLGRIKVIVRGFFYINMWSLNKGPVVCTMGVFTCPHNGKGTQCGWMDVKLKTIHEQLNFPVTTFIHIIQKFNVHGSLNGSFDSQTDHIAQWRRRQTSDQKIQSSSSFMVAAFVLLGWELSKSRFRNRIWNVGW